MTICRVRKRSSPYLIGLPNRFRFSRIECRARASVRTDPASREIWVTDCWMRLDEDGDGYAELRNIIIVGESAITIIH